MSIKDKLKLSGSKVARTALAGVVAFSLMPLPAFAADLATSDADFTTQAGEAKSASGYLLAATHAAAQPAPQFLGLTNPQARAETEVQTISKVFGDDEFNEEVDPYLYNYKNETGGDTPVIGGSNQSPAGNLIAPDFTKGESAWASEAPQNLVLQRKPQIIVGTGSQIDVPSEKLAMYDSDAYARAAETQFKWPANSYHPVGVTYNFTELSKMIDTMYRLADVANDALKADSSLKARYGDPMTWAKLYEVYIMGARGAVKKALDAGTVKQRTVANVVSVSDGVARIIATDTKGSTATKDRYLEAVEGVTANYYDKVDAEVKTGNTDGRQSIVYSYKDVPLDQLKANVDYFLVGGQITTDQASILTALAGLESKTYWTAVDAAASSSGATFGVTANSVENAQNVGRILPGIYPEVLDETDMIAFFYDNFYHLKDGKLGEMVESLMQNAVRNWEHDSAASYLTWTAADVADYNAAKTQSILESGVAYLNELKASEAGLSTALTPTDYVKDIVAATDDAPSAASEKIAVPTAATGLKYTGKTLTGVAAGKGYTVTGGSAKKAGSYTATVTPAQGYVWTDGTSAAKTVKWSIGKAANTIKVKVKSPSVKYSKVKSKAQTIAAKKAFTVSKAKGAVSYKKVKGDKKITVSADGKVTVKKKAKKGTHTIKVKVTAKGNNNYKSGNTIVTLKVKVS